MAGNSSDRQPRWLGQTIEPELALVAACLCRPSDKAAQDRIRDRASGPIDWDRFLAQVTRHRVASLVSEALRGAPGVDLLPAVIDRLDTAARRQARITLSQIAETARLIRLLAQAGIGALVLKGPLLSVIAFGEPGGRNSRDIDLIVEAEALDRVDAILRADGYQRSKPAPGLSAAQLARYRRWVHEFSYFSPALNTLVEVKDRVDPTGSLPPINVKAHIRRPRMVAVGGVELPTVPDVDHFLYLCAHGSRHSWFRLKWIADIGPMLGRMSPAERDAVAERAAAHDLERCLHAALLLAHELLGAPILPAMLADAEADTAARRLAAAAIKRLSFLGRDGDPFSSADFTARLLLEEYRIRSDWGYRWAVLQRHALSHAYPLVAPLVRMADRLRTPG